MSANELEENGPFRALLDYLKRHRGFDFSGYKPASLMRRIAQRMQLVHIERYEDYVDFLEVHPEEFGQLFNMILINVTAFFRDASTWEYLAAEALPRLVSMRPKGPLRIWSAGCASGEEAYTLAIVLAEALGMEAFRERVKIYGTDMDAEALNQARQASYSQRDVEGVPPALREKYFEKVGDRYSFHKDLRRSVIFGRHDLIQDAPISRLDLLVCRNALMYFNAETQVRILDRFHFALNEGGILFLGKAEMLLSNHNSFTPLDLKRRIFTKVPSGQVRDRFWAAPRPGSDGATPLVDHVRIREAAFDTAPVPQVIVDVAGQVAMANESARTLFKLSARDLGRPLQDLELSYRPVELRAPVEQAMASGQPVHLKDVEWSTGGNRIEFDIQVVSLAANDRQPLGASITFTDVTAQRRLQDDLRRSHQDLESANAELQSTNEELETTNEELQSTNEELETTNEELQSTNEELETMNEELQSANEELQTINEELRQRSDELNEVNGFLESILTALRGGVVVTDRDLLVSVWNQQAEELWGLRAEEVRGRHFLNLDIGLPVEQLRQPIRSALAGERGQQDLQITATNRRGKTIECKITCAPLKGPESEVRGVILLMEEARAPG